MWGIPVIKTKIFNRNEPIEVDFEKKEQEDLLHFTWYKPMAYQLTALPLNEKLW